MYRGDYNKVLSSPGEGAWKGAVTQHNELPRRWGNLMGCSGAQNGSPGRPAQPPWGFAATSDFPCGCPLGLFKIPSGEAAL